MTVNTDISVLAIEIALERAIKDKDAKMLNKIAECSRIFLNRNSEKNHPLAISLKLQIENILNVANKALNDLF